MGKHKISLSDKVRVSGTDIQGIVQNIGQGGLILLRLTSEHSVFDRTVFHSAELEHV